MALRLIDLKISEFGIPHASRSVFWKYRNNRSLWWAACTVLPLYYWQIDNGKITLTHDTEMEMDTYGPGHTGVVGPGALGCDECLFKTSCDEPLEIACIIKFLDSVRMKSKEE